MSDLALYLRLVTKVEQLQEQLKAANELVAIREEQLRGELARVAGIQAGVDKTVARAVAKEREACAYICDGGYYASDAAKEIRARGE